MVKKKCPKKIDCSALKDLTFHFTSDEDDTDDESEPEPTPKPRNIFISPNRDRIRLRPSIITKNVRELVSSTPIHSAKKIFNKTLFISPINNAREKRLARRSISLQREAVSSTSTSASKKKVSNETHEDDKGVKTSKSPVAGANIVANDKIRRIFPANDSNIVTSNVDSNVLAETLPSDSENLENSQIPEKADLMVSVNKTLTNVQCGKLMSTSVQTNFSSEKIEPAFPEKADLMVSVNKTLTNAQHGKLMSTSIQTNISSGKIQHAIPEKADLMASVNKTLTNDQRGKLVSTSVQTNFSCNPISRKFRSVVTQTPFNKGTQVTDSLELSRSNSTRHNKYSSRKKKKSSNIRNRINERNYKAHGYSDDSSSSEYENTVFNGCKLKEAVSIGVNTSQMDINDVAENPETHVHKVNGSILKEAISVGVNTIEMDANAVWLNALLSKHQIQRDSDVSEFSVANASSGTNSSTVSEIIVGNWKSRTQPTEPMNRNQRAKENISRAGEDIGTNQTNLTVNKTQTNNINEMNADAENKENVELSCQTRKGNKRKAALNVEPRPTPRTRQRTKSLIECPTDNNKNYGSTTAVAEPEKSITSKNATNPSNTPAIMDPEKRITSKNATNSSNTSAIMEPEKSITSKSATNPSNTENFKIPDRTRKVKNKKIIADTASSGQSVEQHDPEEIMGVELQSSSNGSVGNRSNLNDKSQASVRSSRLKSFIQQQANHTKSTRTNDITDNNLPEIQLDSNENLSNRMSIMETKSKENKKVERRSGMQDLTNRSDFKVPEPIRRKRNKNTVPEIMVPECSNSSVDGVRRSARARKERVRRLPGFIVSSRKEADLQYSNLDPSIQFELSRYQEGNSSRRTANTKQTESGRNSRLNAKTTSGSNAKRIRNVKAREKNSSPTERVKSKTVLRSKQNDSHLDEPIGDGGDIFSNDIGDDQEPSQPLHEEESVKDVEDVFHEIQNSPVQRRWSPRVLLKRLDKKQLNLDSSETQMSSGNILRDYFYFPHNNKVCKMEWCTITPQFGDMYQNDCVRMAIGPKSSYLGFQTGIMEILPGKCKPKDLTKKYSLIFMVADGEALFEVHDSYNFAKRFSIIHVPLGAYYSIKNQSKTESVTIHYVQIKPP